MKYETQRGKVLDLTAPYDVNPTNADLGYQPCFKVGSIIAAAVGGAANGTAIEGQVEFTGTVAKATGAAWSIGDELYWDDTGKAFTKTSSSNTKAAYAVVAALSGDAVGVARLVPTVA